jgi:hypothetical protein
MKIVVFVFALVIYSPCFTPIEVENDAAGPHSPNHLSPETPKSDTTDAAGLPSPRHDPQVPSPKSGTNVPERSKPFSNNKVAETKLKPVPYPYDTFQTMQVWGCTFVDKTNFIMKLTDADKRGPPHVYLLTRPKHFGKTTFLNMLLEYLEGHEKLFKNTAIHSRGNNITEDGTWEKYPVIHLDFSDGALSAKEFISNLQAELAWIAEKNGLQKHGKYWTIKLLINAMESKYQLPVSVLIDDYDHPLMKPYRSKIQNELLMKALTNFYSEIKESAPNLRLVFIMGVSKLKTLHQAWNGFVTDITYDDKYWSVLGFTWDDVTSNFSPHIEKFAKDTGADYADILKELPRLYGFYSFSQKADTGLLMPGSLCECLRDYDLHNYLPRTAAYEEVVERMIQQNITVDEYKFYEIDAEYLRSDFKFQYMKEIPLPIFMLCNGLLTISRRFSKDKKIVLTYPSWEVEERLQTFRDYYAHVSESSNQTMASRLRKALDLKDVETFVGYLNTHAFPRRRSKTSEEFSPTRSIFTILKSMFSDECEEGIRLFQTKDGKSKEKGDIALYIHSSAENANAYVVEVKYEHDAAEAVFELICYIVEDQNSFRSATYSRDSILLGLNVHRRNDTGHNSIDEWVIVPYRERKIWMNELDASFLPGREKVLKDLETRLRNKYKDESKFVTEEIIVRGNETFNDEKL